MLSARVLVRQSYKVGTVDYESLGYAIGGPFWKVLFPLVIAARGCASATRGYDVCCCLQLEISFDISDIFGPYHHTTVQATQARRAVRWFASKYCSNATMAQHRDEPAPCVAVLHGG